MDEATKLGFEFAKEVATELITLSTALLTLTITFTKEMFKAAPGKGQRLLPTAWAAHVLSIAFGVLSLMALTGTLMPVDLATRALVFGPNIRRPAAIQILFFFLGTVLLFVYGLRSFRTTESQPLRRSVVVAVTDAAAFFESQRLDEWDVVQVVPSGASLLVVTLQKGTTRA